MNKLLIVLFNIFLVMSAYAQDNEWQPLTREVVLTQGDSTIRFKILIKQGDVKPDPEHFYYWHNKGQININQGNYAGELLHGEFLVFNTQNKLITKGQLKNGQLEGEWMQWYGNGRLKKVTSYSDGFLDGKVFLYNEQGIITDELIYRRGLLIDKDDKTFMIFNSSGSDSTDVPDETFEDDLYKQDDGNDQETKKDKKTRFSKFREKVNSEE